MKWQPGIYPYRSWVEQIIDLPTGLFSTSHLTFINFIGNAIGSKKHDEHISVNIKHFRSDKMKVLGFKCHESLCPHSNKWFVFFYERRKIFFNNAFKKKYSVRLFFKFSSRYFYSTDNENFSSLFHVALVDEKQISVQGDQNGGSVFSPKVTLVKQNHVVHCGKESMKPWKPVPLGKRY